MLTPAEVVPLFKDQLYPAFMAERLRLNVIDKWYRWHNDDVEIPRGSTREHRSLVALSKTPWLQLIVTEVAQSLFADGYHTPQMGDDEALSTPWRLWNANGFVVRQSAIHRAALAYGYSYATALPADAGSAALRGVSPRKMLAFYVDAAEDDWPLYAVQWVSTVEFKVYDDMAVWPVRSVDGQWTAGDPLMHNAGVCPVVRYNNMLDLDGRSTGEVEPFIAMAKSIDKTKYDRLLTQHFNSFKVRTVTGMVEGATPAETEAAKLKIAHDTVLAGTGSDMSFGSLPETPLDGFIHAYEQEVKTLAAVSQTTVYSLVGDLINVSADGLVAARSSADAKVAERQRSFGQSHSQLLRLGSSLAGDSDAATDVMASIKWADTSIRSMSAAADALGKLATMLGVPVMALWERIPGVSQNDVDRWKQMLPDADSAALEALVMPGASADAGLVA